MILERFAIDLVNVCSGLVFLLQGENVPTLYKNVVVDQDYLEGPKRNAL